MLINNYYDQFSWLMTLDIHVHVTLYLSYICVLFNMDVHTLQMYMYMIIMYIIIVAYTK